MLRVAGKQIRKLLSVTYVQCNISTALHTSTALTHGHGEQESEEEFNTRYVNYFLRDDIDGWEVRKAMNDLLGMDIIVDPSIADAGMRACRQVNDIALAIRWLEGVKEKCGGDLKIAYPYIMQRLKPTLVELGVPTLEELKYDKPELALVSVYDM